MYKLKEGKKKAKKSRMAKETQRRTKTKVGGRRGYAVAADRLAFGIKDKWTRETMSS